MVAKPALASDYDPGQTDLVERTCLLVAKLLGDLMPDVRIVGGLVPGLLIDRQMVEGIEEPHCGTHDLDIGIALGLLDEERYAEIAERLRGAEFGPDTNENGNPTPQRWVHDRFNVRLDFLIPPLAESDRGGQIRHLEEDFGAVVAPGLVLAFIDSEPVELSGRTLLDDIAQATVFVAGPGAFIGLKSYAFDLRGERKDAYDLYYVLRNWLGGVNDVAQRIVLLQEAEPDVANEAIDRLRSNFASVEHVGPRAVARFMRGDLDDDVQADVFGLVSDLLDALSS